MSSILQWIRHVRLGGRVLTIFPMTAVLAAKVCGQAIPAPNYNPSPVFTNPTAITNPYLPYGAVKQDVLTGTEEGKPARVVRTRMSGTRAFTVNGKPVQAIIMADSAFENGQLVEVALDYYAQSDAGDVYYLGEDVNNYRDGQVANHEGSWLYGTHTDKLGIMFPATPKIGQRYRSEDVGTITREDDEVVALHETVTVPAGSYHDCVKVKETLSDGAVEWKLYCPGVGIVQESATDGKTDLQSHT